MLKSVTEIFPDPVERFASLLLSNHIARDPETGVYLSASRGRARRGTGSTYFLLIPQRQRENKRAIRFRAFSDSEAIEMANRRLTRMDIECPKTCELCGPLLKQHGLLYKCPHCGAGYDRHSHKDREDWAAPAQSE